MNVAMFVDTFPKLSETFILDQITGLLDLGHSVDIYARRPPASGPVHSQVHEYELLKRTLYLGKSVPQFRTSKYDIVHCQFGPLGNRFSYLKEIWETKLVVSFRGYDFSQLPLMHGDDLYTELFKISDLVTVVSTEAGTRLVELGCPPEKLSTLHSGTNLAEFSFHERHFTPDTPLRMITVARLVEKKGIEYGIRAVKLLLEERELDLQYRIIGDGPLGDSLRALVEELGLSEHVELLGPMSHGEVQELLSASHLFLLPCVTANDGNQEGIPGSLREAMASGLPVLSTWHSGIPELVTDGQSGYLVSERDVSALADRLRFLIEHPERWPELGRAGRARVEETFDVDALNRRLSSLYSHILKGGIPAEYQDGISSRGCVVAVPETTSVMVLQEARR